LILGRKSRSEMIGVFLAVLELIREKKILVTQNETLGEMEIASAPAEHRKQYAQASLHLADEAAPLDTETSMPIPAESEPE
jgi:segregation and condensation protein A